MRFLFAECQIGQCSQKFIVLSSIFAQVVEFLETRKNAAKVLQPVKQALHFIAFPVELAIIVPRLSSVDFGGTTGIMLNSNTNCPVSSLS